MSKISKRKKKISQSVEKDRVYDLDEAIKIVKDSAVAKFDETIEISMNLGVDPKHSDQIVRGVCAMPSGLGKEVRVAVFARGAKIEEAKQAKADIVGAEDLAEKIEKGEIDFDRVIATPDAMTVVGKLGKILGPRGLMPNPKLGTVTMDVATAIKAVKAGSVEFRAEKAGIVHGGVGKASFTIEQIKHNVTAFIDSVKAAKPAVAKGNYINKMCLSSTMGIGVAFKIDNI